MSLTALSCLTHARDAPPAPERLRRCDAAAREPLHGGHSSTAVARRLGAGSMLLLGLLLPLTALAFTEDGGVLQADFESGVVTKPAGPFDIVDVTDPANTFAAEPAAAHRGQFGARLVESGQPAGVAWAAAAKLSGVTYLGRVHARLWVRLNASVPASSTFLMLSCGGLSIYGGNSFSASGADAVGFSGVTSLQSFATGLAAGWHLVEAEVVGMGSTSGYRRLWLDGELQGQSGTVDLSNQSCSRVSLGLPHSDSRSYRGSVDFDDVRVGPTLQAQRFSLSLGEDGTAAGGCMTGQVLLVDADGAPAPAPYEVDVGVTAIQGDGELSSGASCSEPSTSLRMAAGASSVAFSFRPATDGPLELAAAHPDFLPDEEATVIRPAAQPQPLPGDDPAVLPAGSSLLRVGCACDGGAGVSLGLPLGLLLLRVGGRRSRGVSRGSR